MGTDPNGIRDSRGGCWQFVYESEQGRKESELWTIIMDVIVVCSSVVGGSGKQKFHPGRHGMK